MNANGPSISSGGADRPPSRERRHGNRSMNAGGGGANKRLVRRASSIGGGSGSTSDLLTPRVITMLIVLIALLIVGELLFFTKWLGDVELEQALAHGGGGGGGVGAGGGGALAGWPEALEGDIPMPPPQQRRAAADRTDGKLLWGGGADQPLSNFTYYAPPSAGTYPIHSSLSDLLSRAGLNLGPELMSQLPPMDEVRSLYGDRPVILNEGTCATFRETVPNVDAFIAMAGQMNTGTNLLQGLLAKNCYLPEKVKKFGPEKVGMRGQVPWGKHNPVSWRGHHNAEPNHIPKVGTSLPILLVKDPYTWMTSMCRHAYGVQWDREGRRRCPNLINARSGRLNGVTIPFPRDKVSHYDSFADMWNEWYADWLRVGDKFPHLIVRFEDVLFHTEEVTEVVCKCGGGVMRDTFTYITGQAKQGLGHKGSSTMTDAIIRYSSEKVRTEPFSPKDLEYARKTLRPDMMELLHYQFPGESKR